MKERLTEATVHVVSSAIVGGAAHLLYGRLFAVSQRGVAHDTQQALFHASLSVVATAIASAAARRIL